MKKVILLFAVSMFILPLYAQFTAELTIAEQGNKKIYLIQSDGSKYRYDFEEDGMKGVVIVDPVANRTAILYPDRKYVRYTETTSAFSGMMDPNQGFKRMQNRFTEKNIGAEKILGVEAEKLELYAGDEKVITAWYSKELSFLVRMTYQGRENTFVELSNIEQRDVDASVFTIPEDYIEVDDQMRVMIPEPPPPESWKTIEATLPVKGEFVRGDQIVFNVQKNKYLYVYLKNETSKPAKIITILSMRNGMKVPDKDQYPVSYRTKRLYKNETESFGNYWEPGDDLIIQVHEGKMHIEVAKEKL